MTEPTFFSVVADYKSVVIDAVTDVDANPQTTPISATVTFKPVLRDGDAILATDATPRPTGYVPAPIVAKLNTSGRLVLRDVPDGTRENVNNFDLLPSIGDPAKYYVTTNDGRYWRWSGGDTKISKVTSLLTFDGVNNATTVTDTAPEAGSWTLYGGAKLSTSIKKFGSASLTLDGTGDYAATPASSRFNFSGQSFTVECWIRPADTVDGARPIIGQRTTNVVAPFVLYQDGRKIKLLGGNAALDAWAFDSASGDILTAGAWYHIALVGDATNLKVYVNGVLRITGTQESWPSANRPLTVGMSGDPDISNFFYGNVDSLRVTKTVARYTAAFTPPIAEFPGPNVAPGYIEVPPYQPVRLLADTPLLELESPLYYSVSFSQVIYNGRVGKLNGFVFQAPTSDTELNLIEVMRQPGQPASGITKIAPGAVRLDDGDIVFSFAGVDIPDPIPFEPTFTPATITGTSPAIAELLTTATPAQARAAINADIYVNAKDFGVVGDGVTDDTESLQDWINYVVPNRRQGWLPEGTYKITETLVCPTNFCWGITGESSQYTTILQATNNIPILQIGDQATAESLGAGSHSYTLRDLTLKYATAQPSTNTDACCIVFEGADPDSGVDPSVTYWAQFDRLFFMNGYYGFRTGVNGYEYAPWGCTFDRLGMTLMSGGLYDNTNSTGGTPNNYWGRATLNCAGAAGPIFKAWRGANTFVATLEFLNATEGPVLIETTPEFQGTFGSVKVEQAIYERSGAIFNFTGNHHITIGVVQVEGSTAVFEPPSGVLAIVGYGAGTQPPTTSRLHIGSIWAQASSLTGTCVAINGGSSPNRRATVGTAELRDGWTFQPTGSSETSLYTRNESWLNNGLSPALPDANYTITAGDFNRLWFNTAFTAQRTITLPSRVTNDACAGLYYDLIFDGAINGSNTAVIKERTNTLRTQTVDKVRLRYSWVREDGYGTWVLTEIASLDDTLRGKTISGSANTLSDIPQASVTNLTTDLAAKESTANKNQNNGYAGLDSGGKIAAAQLPSYVDDVLEYANLAGFPAAGSTGLIYVALDSNKIYRWSGSTYVEISPSPGSTDSVTEGSTNLYYTNARADARIAAAVGSTVQAYDADLTAFAAKTAPTGAVVGTTDTQALTNKDLSGAGNTFPTFNQSTTGNAATATKLATARNINGVSFDGTANITVSARSLAEYQSDATTIGSAANTDYVAFANVSGDASADKLVALLHLDGSNNSTTITDSVLSGPTWTANGDAKLSTSVKKFGTASLLLDGAGDYLSTPAASRFNFSGTAFCVEGWIYPANISSGLRGIFGQRADGGFGTWFLYQDQGVVKLQVANAALDGWDSDSTSGAVLSATTWHHVAVAGDATNIKVFVDGVQVINVSQPAWTSANRPLLIGSFGNPASGYQFNGYIDEVRVTKGAARYTAAFTAPTAAFANQTTIVLPSATANLNHYTVKNLNAAPIYVTTTSAQTIDGATSYLLTTGSTLRAVSYNSNWQSV